MSDIAETTGQEPGAGAEERPARTYTNDEVEALVASKLRGQGKVLKELEKKAQRLDELERQRVEAEENEAKKRGEFENLHKAAKADAEAARREAEEYKQKIESLEALLVSEVESQVASIEDKVFRKQVEQRLKGRGVLDQRDILSLVMAARGSSTPPTQPETPRKLGGAPGQPTRGVPGAKELDSRSVRNEAALALLADFRLKQAGKYE